jgi:hypothetical protein
MKALAIGEGFDGSRGGPSLDRFDLGEELFVWLKSGL